MFPPSEILIGIAFWVGLAFLYRPLFDEWLGSPLTEEVEVLEKRFIKGRPYYPSNDIDPHSSSSDTYNLRVANTNGEGWVQTTKKHYRQTSEGDNLLVSGKKGRLTGHWYLKNAGKKCW